MIKKAKKVKDKKSTLLKKTRFFFFIIAILSIIVLQILSSDGKYINVKPYLIILFLSSIFIFGWLLDLNKLSNTILSLITLLIISIILIQLKLPLSDNFFVFSYFLLILYYIVFSVKSIIFLKENNFLKILAFVGSFVLILMFFPLIVDTKHRVFSYIPDILFVGVSLAMIFGLPNSNYPDWTKSNKKIFLKSILIPWIIVYIWSSINFFYTKDFSKNLIDMDSVKWEMKDYNLKKLPGLKIKTQTD